MKFLDRLRIGSVFRNIEWHYLKWALAEMGGDHPDVPRLVLRCNQLESK